MFSKSWLYTPRSNHSFSTAYCAEAFRQGPTSAAYKKVDASFDAWKEDNVNILFN